MALRVLLADDNTLFRDGLADLLGGCADTEVVGQARDAHEVVHKAALLRPDVVLMDLAMPGGGGVAATRALQQAHPDLAICILTVSEQADDLFAAIRAGARGYLVKSVTLDDLCAGLRVLAAGGSVVTPQLAARLLEEFALRAPTPQDDPGHIERLSPRERQVLELVAQGYSNKAMGQTLVIAENTVKVHLRNILDKLQLRNRQQAAAFAAQQGLAGPPRDTDADRSG